MSTPQSESIVTAPQANLQLYGALDDIFVRAIEEGDAETAGRVDQYLPGSAEYPGWADELRGLFGQTETFSGSISENVAFALNGILTKSEADPEALTIPDKANLIYVIGALSHFDAADPNGNSDLFAQVLALAGLEDFSPEERRAKADAFLSEGLLMNLHGWQDWPAVIQMAVENDWVEDIFATVPQCSTSVVTVDGLECVSIDVVIQSDDVSLVDLLKWVDPRNWPDAYPGFFCRMDDALERVPPDQWWNIRETVGFCPVEPNTEFALTQRLRFLKSNQTDGDRRLDFDLAEKQDNCSGKVLVDKGFVNMTCTNKDGNIMAGGVRLYTKKVAHIKGISPYAQAFWLCKLGYGWVAVQLFFGKAMKGNQAQGGYVGWEVEPVIDEPYSDLPDGKDEVDADDGAAVAAAAGGAAPADDKPQVATKTAKRLAEVANYLTKTNLDLTEKWLKGNLSFGDLAKYGHDVGGKLASEPWEWLQDITTGTKPGNPPGGAP